MRLEQFYETALLVSTGDSLGFGPEGVLEYSNAPFSEPAMLSGFNSVLEVVLEPRRFPISDDSITTHLTILALIRAVEWDNSIKAKEITGSGPKETLLKHLSRFSAKFGHYLLDLFIDLQTTPDPIERAWGGQMFKLWERFSQGKPDHEEAIEKVTPFDSRAGGNGGAMHAVPIGLMFGESNTEERFQGLIAVAVESGRVTHNHPTGFLGSVAVAFFVSCALQKKNPDTWALEFVDVVIPATRKYLQDSQTDTPDYDDGFAFFTSKWNHFIQEMGLRSSSRPELLADGVSAHSFLSRFAFGYPDGDYWAGSSGHDAPMFMIYGILSCKGNYRTFIDTVCNHPGDCDSTGAISLPIYGLVFGISQVPRNHLDFLERREMLSELCNYGFPLIEKWVSNLKKN